MSQLPQDLRLTRWTQAGGCACKVGPKVLEDLLRTLPSPRDSRLLVGPELRDDAAVFAFTPERALIFTTDFFPPLVDDPVAFGEIAAANALSDIYAMGGEPLMALYLVGFPLTKGMPLTVLEDILRGASRILEEARCLGAGGHTLDTPEPIFGLAVTGEVHPGKIWKNSGAQPGDRLFLTKPLGTGILATAYKKGRITAREYEPALQSMRTLNRQVCAILSQFPEGWVHAVTDVTGFGLLGHLVEMLKGAGISCELYLQHLPFFPGVLSLVEEGILPQGGRRNQEYTKDYLEDPPEFDPRFSLALDPQTNGGFLIALSPEGVPALTHSFAQSQLPLWEIGRFISGSPPRICFLKEQDEPKP